jgi:hypothetical protein
VGIVAFGIASIANVEVHDALGVGNILVDGPAPLVRVNMTRDDHVDVVLVQKLLHVCLHLDSGRLVIVL